MTKLTRLSLSKYNRAMKRLGRAGDSYQATRLVHVEGTSQPNATKLYGMTSQFYQSVRICFAHTSR